MFSLEGSPEVALSMTGRDLYNMISAELPSKPGSRISVQNGQWPLWFGLTLRQQGFSGDCVTLAYVYVPVDVLAAWKYFNFGGEQDDECALQGLTRIGGNESAWQLQKLPSSLKHLELGDGFDEGLEEVNFPSGITTISFGRCFNQSLDGVTFPPGLQSLTFENFGQFNQSLAAVVLPASLQTLTLGYTFNQSLHGVTLPAGLQTLTLDFSFNESLDGVTLPAGLQTLIFG